MRSNSSFQRTGEKSPSAEVNVGRLEGINTMLKKLLNIMVVSMMALFFLAGCDPNSKPTYGESTGLSSNCRAYVQVAVDAYRNKEYAADETMAGLERNCGVNGHLWSKQ